MLSGFDLFKAEIVPELARVTPRDEQTPETRLQKLKRRLDRVVDDTDAVTREGMMESWRATDPAGDDEADLCVILADIVNGKERERLFRAAVVLAATVITCSDTLSDASVTALYVREGNAIGVPMLVHLIVSLVRRGGHPRAPF